METLFSAGGCKEQIQQYCLNNRLPGLYSDTASLIWLAAPQYVYDTLTDIYLIGPVFSSPMSEQAFTRSLRSLRVDAKLVQSASSILQSVPIVHHTFLMHHGLMLHRCLTGVKPESADIQIISPVDSHPRIPDTPERESRTGTYALKQQIFKAVEEGFPAVDEQALMVPLNFADAKLYFRYILHRAVLCEGNTAGIEVGSLVAPQLSAGDVHRGIRATALSYHGVSLQNLKGHLSPSGLSLHPDSGRGIAEGGDFHPLI